MSTGRGVGLVIKWVVYSQQRPTLQVTPLCLSQASESAPLTNNYLANSWEVQVHLLGISRFSSSHKEIGTVDIVTFKCKLLELVF